MIRKIGKHSISAILIFSVVLAYIAAAILAAPTIDSYESTDRFFYLTLAAAGGTIIATFFCLLRDIDHYARQIMPTLILVLRFVTALGCIYLFSSWRLGYGLFATT